LLSTLDFGLHLPEVIVSKLAAEANPRFPSTRNPFDPQCHGPSAPKAHLRTCNSSAVCNCLQGRSLGLSGILIVQEFPCNEESMGFFKIKAQMGL
jgi:hypothetical protein